MATQAEVLAWLQERFKGHLDGADDLNYVEAGLVDSFGVIQLVSDIEDCFRVQFDQSDFEDPRFSTVDGLAQLVAEIAVR